MCNTQTHTMTLFLSLYFIAGSWNHCKSDCPNAQYLIIPYCVCMFVWVCVQVCQGTYSCMCVYASCCWIGIVFSCASDRAIWERAQGGEANADLMSRRACRIEKCISTVMWGDVPISPWGITVLSCSRWGTPARPHPSTSSLLLPYTCLSKIIPLVDVWALARSPTCLPWE